MNASLLEIAQTVQGKLVGDAQLMISGLSPIENITAGSLVFADGQDNLTRAEQSLASAILVNHQTESSIKPVIQVNHPFKAFIQLIDYFYPANKPAAVIHKTAVIGDNVQLGNNISVGAYVVIEDGASIGNDCIIKSHVHIGHDVKLGDGCVIHPHVTIYDNCQLGSQVIIHASTVIGSDGFGYTFTDGAHLKIPHAGYVKIGNNVEIGANTVVDRATLGATTIGEGTKIDNLVQIAHSVQLGKHNILCAFTGIAGSTTSGDGVIFAANVGVSDHVRIDDGVILAARAGVPPKKHLKHGNIYLGNPARPKDKAIEQELSVTRIPLMRKNFKALSEKVTLLSKRIEMIEEGN